MDKQQGYNEIVFYMTLNVVKKMLDEGAITREQYEQFNTRMLEKYSPLFGDLFSDIDLI